MSYLLEKLAARAVVRRWNDLSNKTKDRIRREDPDSAHAYNRHTIGEENSRQVRKAEYLGGQKHTFQNLDQTASKFKEFLPYSSNPGAEFSTDTDGNIHLDGFAPIISRPSAEARRDSSLFTVLGDQQSKQFRKGELFDSIVSRKGISALPKSLRDEYIKNKKDDISMTSRLTKGQQDAVRKIFRKQNAFFDSSARAVDKGDSGASIGHELSEIVNSIRNIRSATKDGEDIMGYAKRSNQGIGTHSSSNVLIDEASQYHKLPEQIKKRFILQRSTGEKILPFEPDERPSDEAVVKYQNMPQIELLRPGSADYGEGFDIRKAVSNTQRRRILERASKIQKEMFPGRETDFDVAKRRFSKWTKKRH